MKKGLLTAVLSAGLLFSTATPTVAATTRSHYIRHRRHMKTLKRVGIGAAGGAVTGAIVAGAPGAVIGGAAGAGAGYLYDRHKRHKRRHY
jgi:uncharacterized membrane protein